MPNLYVDHVNGDNNSTIYIHDAELRNTLGQANGIATLDNTGKLPSSQLPDSVNNKLEASTLASENETEETTTATKTHAKDSKFYIEATGEYCMAKTAIAIGDTLVKDTNYQVISINGFLTSLESYLILAGQMLETKADKVSSATDGNLAGLNGQGNLTDSGWNGAKDTTSISGNPISISGLKANQLAINPIITFEPIQAGSGTPSPSNIRAISGYDKIEVLSCGHNRWDEQVTKGYYWSASIGSAISKTAHSSRSCSTNPIPVVSGVTYYFYGSSSYSVYLWFTDANGIVLSSSDTWLTLPQTFTVPNGACRLYFSFSANIDYTSGISINYPSTYTEYSPYDKTTDLSEALGQTVYGLTDDVRSGLCTDIWTKIDASTLSWGYNGTQKRYEADLPNAKSVGSGRSDKIVCSKYATDVDVTAGDSWKVFQSGRTVFVYDASQSGTPSGDIAYILANTTIQLTPHEISLLKDYAYVSTNGTNIALDYHNGELASLADVSQLGETVNELGNYVGANNLGSQNAIVIPETGNFICPSDGYVVVRSGNNASDFYRVDVYGSQKVSTNRIIIKVNATPDTASKYQYFSVYVRKGMIVTFGEKSSGNTTGGANFVTIE